MLGAHQNGDHGVEHINAAQPNDAEAGDDAD